MEEFSKYMLEDGNDDILFQMKWALREKDYMAAFSYARMLERAAFLKYKDENEQAQDYISLLKIMIVILLKIKEEFEKRG